MRNLLKIVLVLIVGLISHANAQTFPGQSIANVQTSNYSIQTTDCYRRVSLGGNAFFTLTVPSAAGFPSDCVIDVVNVDAGRGKTISGVTLPIGANAPLPNILYPLQTFGLKIVNGAWNLFYAPTRWKSAGNITLNTDFTNGNDANDGLATGAGNALKTVNQCMLLLIALSDQAAGFNANTCKMAAGSTDTTLVHVSATVPGASGSQQVIIDGNGTGTLSGNIQGFNGAVFSVQNVTITGTNCLEAGLGSTITIGPGVTFGACTGVDWFPHDGGKIQLGSNTTVSGNTPFILLAQNNGIFNANGLAITIGANITVTDTVACNFQSICQFQGATWPLGGHTVTGTAFSCIGNATVNGAAAIPGTVAGSATSGCNTDNNPTGVAAGGTGDSGTAWGTYSPAPACGTATITTPSSVARFKTLGKTTWAQIDFTITAIGTCTSPVTFTLPNTANSSGTLCGGEQVNGKQIVCCLVAAGSATATCQKGAAVAFGVNDHVAASGTYENQ
jgi:hypothetical protein